MRKLDRFLHSLQDYEPSANVFNPWRGHVDDLDIGPQAPVIRTKQLREYLSSRIPTARYLLVAEAKGYQGGRFTGVPLASERILLGHHREIAPTVILPSGGAKQTSLSALQKQGFAEPTATIVWKAVLELGLAPEEVVTWNIFPFHPFDPKKGYLSNRTPTSAELEEGRDFFLAFQALFPKAETIVAIGRKAEHTLRDHGIDAHAVRHPANGGAAELRANLHDLFHKKERLA